MNKYVIIINGTGGSGKDTCVSIVEKVYLGKVLNVSSIDPIKKIARTNGWWNGDKDSASRRFLSDFKKTLDDYMDITTEYILDKYNRFLKDDTKEYMFIHIREPKNIQKVVDKINGVITLLIDRENIEGTVDGKWGNSSDDEVFDYNYDWIFYNNHKTIKDLEETFIPYFDYIISSIGIL